MDSPDASVITQFLCLIDFGLSRAMLHRFCAEFCKLWILARSCQCDFVVWGERNELGSKKCIWPRCEYFDLFFGGRGRFWVQTELNFQSFRPADPILLHQPDLFRPALERPQRVQ